MIGTADFSSQYSTSVATVPARDTWLVPKSLGLGRVFSVCLVSHEGYRSMTPHLGYHYYKLQVLLRFSASATPALTPLLSSLASALICLMLPLLSASQALGLTTVGVAAAVAAAGQPSPGRAAVLPNALPHFLPRLAFPILRRPAVPRGVRGWG